MKVLVTAPWDEVEHALSAELSPDEFRMIQMDVAEQRPLLQPSPRRAEPVTTIALWVGEAVAAGLTYDALKAITLKARDILTRKFGKEKVRTDGQIP